MKKFVTLFIVLSTPILVFTSFREQPQADYQVPYPHEYRDWTHVKSKVAGPSSIEFKVNGGLNHTYANEKAMQGYRSGKFPEGSILVFDVMLVREDSLTKATVEWKRKRIDVMVKDSIKYALTGGWGYGQFKEDSEIGEVLSIDTKSRCFACHTSQKDYVFSEYRK